MTDKDFCFQELPNDLFRSVASSRNFNPPFFDPHSNIVAGPILGGQINLFLHGFVDQAAFCRGVLFGEYLLKGSNKAGNIASDSW